MVDAETSRWLLDELAEIRRISTECNEASAARLQEVAALLRTHAKDVSRMCHERETHDFWGLFDNFFAALDERMCGLQRTALATHERVDGALAEFQQAICDETEAGDDDDEGPDSA